MRPRCVHLLPATEAAGAENQALSLLRQLRDRAELNLELVCFRRGRNHERFVELGIPVHVLESRARLSIDFPRRVRALRRLYADNPPDVLHTWLFEGNIVGLLAARRWPRTAVVISQRSGVAQRTMRRHLVATRVLLGRADHAISNSDEGATILCELGMDRDNVTVTGQGVAPERLEVGRSPEEVRASLGVDAAAPLLVAVGRAHSDKDWPGLMTAMTDVRAAFPDVRLTIVGPTPDEMSTLGLELPADVTAIGWQENPADFLNAASVVVIPSWTEGHSNVASEALLLGRPVATTDAGAHPRTVAAAGGRVVPARRPDLLAQAIVTLLEQPPDPESVKSRAAPLLDSSTVTDLTMQVYRAVSRTPIAASVPNAVP